MIAIGEARLLLYLNLQDVHSTQPGCKTILFLAMTLGTECQYFADVTSL